MFDHILLEPEQEELLTMLVEAARNVPREKREKFMLFVSLGSRESFIEHSGFPSPLSNVYKDDIETLGTTSLISITYRSTGILHFNITPLGFRYYEYLKQQLGESIQRVETSIHNFLDTETFQRKYPVAYQNWAEAEKLLWSSDSSQQLTTIGHLCREAIQEFATALVERYQPQNINKDKTKTVARIKAVFAMQSEKLGPASELLDALIVYWGELSDLIQRQEHGGQKEGQALIWEDGRRVVFYTAVVMFEIDHVLP